MILRDRCVSCNIEKHLTDLHREEFVHVGWKNIKILSEIEECFTEAFESVYCLQKELEIFKS